MIWLFQTLFYRPLFNVLVLLLPVVKGDFGLAIVLFTILIRLVLFPLAQKSIKTQRAMQVVQPEINRINEQYKDDKQEQARQLMAIYQKYDINPFSGILLTFIQLPIIYYLYKSIRTVNSTAVASIASLGLLYSFVHAPAVLNTHFLGFIDITTKSIVFALITGVVQYFQGYFATAAMKQNKPADGKKAGFGADMNQALMLQMKYVFPVLMAFIAYASGAIALYLITSGLFTIGQELLIRRNRKQA